jgi:hypothetical protein
MRCVAWLWVLLVAGCPPKTATAPQIPEGGPCPSAAGVYIASYVTNEAGKGHTGWVMPLHAMAVDPSAQVADWAPLDATAASVSGVPAPPQAPMWLMTPNAPPCQVKIGNYYAAKLPGPPANVSYGVELDGCPAPLDAQESGGIVLVAAQAPGGCTFQAPHPGAARLGELDTQKRWQRPARESPIPGALAGLVPAHDCDAPGCERLWAIGEIDIGDRPLAWSAAVNWVTIREPTDPCTWQVDRWSGIFAAGGNAKPIKLDSGEHPLVLSAALVDRTGVKVLLAEGPGTFATYDFVGDAGRPAHAITWMLAPTEAWDAVDRLAPVCERPVAKPAPLPKDAKPVSPY